MGGWWLGYGGGWDGWLVAKIGGTILKGIEVAKIW
jgi:hypothetical protein